MRARVVRKVSYVASFFKRNKQPKGKHAKGAAGTGAAGAGVAAGGASANASAQKLKQELYESDPDSPTTVLAADSDTTMLSAGEAQAGGAASSNAGATSDAAGAALAAEEPAGGADATNTEVADAPTGVGASQPAKIEDILNAEPPGTTVLNIADVRHITSVEECDEAVHAEKSAVSNEEPAPEAQAENASANDAEATSAPEAEVAAKEPAPEAETTAENPAPEPSGETEDSEAETQPVEEDAIATGFAHAPEIVSDNPPEAKEETPAGNATAPSAATSSATPAASPQEKPAGIFLTRKKTGEVFPVTREYTTVGKSKYSDIQIKDTQTVSRNHIILQQKEGRLFVEDDESLNGTFINNERMKSGSKSEIFDGCVLRLSDEELTVSIN